MNKKLVSLILAVMLVMSMVLTGCSGEDSNKPANDENGDVSDDKSLVIAIVNDPVSLDPHARDSGTEMQIGAHLYDPLVDYDPDLSLKPGLAESWEIKDDGFTWEFKLRKGVKFQNGNDFSADDVEFTLNRIMNNDVLQMGVYLFRIAEVKKIDDYTVQIVTKVKYPVFAGSLKHIMILDKETCENMSDEEIAENPNGTGRYKLVEHVRESHLDLVRNEDYWGEKPEAKNIRFRVISNPATRTAALLNGDVDLISNVPTLDVDKLKESNDIEIVTNPSLSCNYLGLNQHDDDSEGTISPNPLKNVKVRQAIYHAIDLDTIIKTTMNGLATPAVSYMPSIVNGFDDSAERLPYDPEKAKGLLAEAGYPDGFSLRIDAINDGGVNEDQVAQAVASYLEKIGIKVEVNLMPRAMFHEKTNPNDMQSSFFLARWGDSSGEGMVILNDMVYTYEGKPGLGEGNKGKYSNPKVDELLDKATITEDKEERAKIVREVDAIAREEVACIPLFFANEIYGVRSNISYTPRADGHLLTWDIKFK